MLPLGEGAYTMTLEPPVSALVGEVLPKGAGHATSTMAARTAAISLSGRLGDGQAFTASLLPAQDRSYRLWINPYGTRVNSHLSGRMVLQPHPDSIRFPGRYYIPAEAGLLFWKKQALTGNVPVAQLDRTYRAGFGTVTTVMTLDPWLPPQAARGNVPAMTLASRLGLVNNNFQSSHSDTGSALHANLPTRLNLNSNNSVSISIPALNPTKWKVALNATLGTFSGNFEFSDTSPRPRIVNFSGVLRQPATVSDLLIGNGHFVLPPLTGSEHTTGEVMFLRE